MVIIKHRINSINSLLETPSKFGIEIDIRSYKNELILNHDPYFDGEKIENFLKNYNHQFLILNVKEEGLEKRLIELMKSFKIRNYFFLDQSFPFLLKTTKSGENRCAVRFSEYESINTVLSLSNIVKWVWVDFFTKFPLDHEEYLKLKESMFNICLVSPELQGHDKEKIVSLQKELIKNKIYINAVCTKYPELWNYSNLFIST